VLPFTQTFQLRRIDFRNPDVVAALVAEIHGQLFPDADVAYIYGRFRNTVKMFHGGYPGYQVMDTAYHDLEHTMQATLCLYYLLANRHLRQAQPILNESDFNVALVAMLLHDIGYLKALGDDAGTGAKYTHVHELRSCRHARQYLTARQWPEAAILSVERLISSTGPRSDLSLIHFESESERILGQAVCTADFIGQMSDPSYVEKLPALYAEFEESYAFQMLPPEERPFSSYEDMLAKTPGFWEEFVHWKMTEQCGNLWHYFQAPDGSNPYIDAVEQNIKQVHQLVRQLQSKTA